VHLYFLSHFEKQNPTVLLRITKGFLNWKQEETTLCNSVLAKYIFEKWRRSLPNLKVKNRNNKIANSLLSVNYGVRVLQALTRNMKEKKIKRNCQHIYASKIKSAAFESLANYTSYRADKRGIREIGEEFAMIRGYKIAHQLFTVWLQKTVISI